MNNPALNILLVDDNEQMRNSIRRTLMRDMHDLQQVYECTDGIDALKMYSTCHPDWVLMDIRMKQMDGFEASKEIIAKYPDAKIIMVTQFDEPALQEKAKEAGAMHFVLKENLSEVEQIIRTYHN